MSIDRDYLDYESAIARLGGNAAIYEKLLKLFLAEDHGNQVTAAANDGNFEKVLQLAHALKGVCANLSLNKLKDITSEIEARIKGNEDCKDCLPEFNAAYQKTVELVNGYLNK